MKNKKGLGLDDYLEELEGRIMRLESEIYKGGTTEGESIDSLLISARKIADEGNIDVYILSERLHISLKRASVLLNTFQSFKKTISREEKNNIDQADDILNEAIVCVRQAGKGSATLLQARLSVGYARAARLIQKMEEMGIISEANGSKPREILISSDSQNS